MDQRTVLEWNSKEDRIEHPYSCICSKFFNIILQQVLWLVSSIVEVTTLHSNTVLDNKSINYTDFIGFSSSKSWKMQSTEVLVKQGVE
mmetsp:Transcript_6682/g.10161  ORF Transcript_6682/g.10161 Transcript_6682/m.10161 type:complete len:88 (+) Transcript_6682:198-461(+)